MQLHRRMGAKPLLHQSDVQAQAHIRLREQRHIRQKPIRPLVLYRFVLFSEPENHFKA
jgi:hypothetical protein